MRTHHTAASLAATFAASVASGTEALRAVGPLLRCDHDPGDPAEFGTALDDRGHGETQLATVGIPNHGHLDLVVTSPKRQIAPPRRIVDLDGALVIDRGGWFGHTSVVPLRLAVQPSRPGVLILSKLTSGSELDLTS